MPCTAVERRCVRLDSRRYDRNKPHARLTQIKCHPIRQASRQKVRRFHPDRQLVIQTEVDNLLHNGFIRAFKYPNWLANVVVVPKKGNKWRVCVDYTNLNDACPKDSFPLPRIDQIVDASAGHGMLSFLDAFSGYHQIPMHSPNAEKNFFHHSPWSLLLQCNAFRFEKRWGYL